MVNRPLRMVCPDLRSIRRLPRKRFPVVDGGGKLTHSVKALLVFTAADIAVGVNHSDSSGTTPSPVGAGRYDGFPIWCGHAARGAILLRIRHRARPDRRYRLSFAPLLRWAAGGRLGARHP